MRKTLSKWDWEHFQTNSYLQYDADGCKMVAGCPPEHVTIHSPALPGYCGTAPCQSIKRATVAQIQGRRGLVATWLVKWTKAMAAQLNEEAELFFGISGH
ncbi:uncharacterized protein ACIQIH_012679 isoform 5-T10 [Cyanocitta cristata]